MPIPSFNYNQYSYPNYSYPTQPIPSAEESQKQASNAEEYNGYTHFEPSAPPMEEDFNEPATNSVPYTPYKPTTVKLSDIPYTPYKPTTVKLSDIPYAPYKPTTVKTSDIPYTPFTPPAKKTAPEAPVEKQETQGSVLSTLTNVASVGVSIIAGVASFSFSVLKFGGSTAVNIASALLETSPEELEKRIDVKIYDLSVLRKNIEKKYPFSLGMYKKEISQISTAAKSKPISEYNQTKQMLEGLEKNIKVFEKKMDELHHNFQNLLQEEMKKHL